MTRLSDRSDEVDLKSENGGESKLSPLALISHTAEECSEQWMEKDISVFENDIFGIGLLDALIQPVCVSSL